jgi:hypothetical protein
MPSRGSDNMNGGHSRQEEQSQNHPAAAQA